jgi:D-arabinose 1-dehydrogenase-like Zn-dependent alcohol dehydrogenase
MQNGVFCISRRPASIYIKCMFNAKAYSAASATSPLASTTITRREADVEVIPIQKINEAYERLLKSDVKYRFSIDMASLKSE